MGMCLRNGLTTTDPNEAYSNDIVTKQADKVILLADSSKADKFALLVLEIGAKLIF